MQYSDNNEKGFTLIELMITIVIMTLLLLFIIPNYQNFQRAIQEELIILQFSEDLMLAKNLANIEDSAVTLCGSLDGKHCIDADRYNWPGWVMFYDIEAKFQPTSENIIHYFSPEDLSPSGISIISTRNIGGGINIKPRRQYAYGMARSLPNGRINLCPDHPHSTAQYTSIVINVYGYSRLEKKSGIC